MKVLGVSLNSSIGGTSPLFNGKRNSKYARKTSGLEQDSFQQREDKNTKAYRTLIMGAYEAERNKANIKLKTSDIRFLLDIKDYEKFRSIISTPVTIKKTVDEEKRNIFFYTDASATRTLAKKLNENGDRALLKKLLMQTAGYSENTVFHKMAKEDDIKKVQALKDSLSAKEFRRFMCAKNLYFESPYGIVQENGGQLKPFLNKLFEGELIPY